MSDSSAIGCKPRGTLTPDPRYVLIHGHPWDSVPGLPCRQLQQMPATLAVFFLRLHFFTIIYRLYKSVHRWRTYNAHYNVYTVHYTKCSLCTLSSKLYTLYIMNIANYKTAWYKLYNAYWTLLFYFFSCFFYKICCLLHTVHRTVYTVHCIMYD